MTDSTPPPLDFGHFGVDGQVESELRSTLDDAGIGTWSWDLIGGKVSLSNTCAELLGAPRLEFEDMGVLQTFVHPADRKTRATALEHAVEMAALTMLIIAS
jgi:two-component system sensor kinase FixL